MTGPVATPASAVSDVVLLHSTGQGAVYGERLSLAPEIPSTYIVAAHDRTIRPEWQRRMARERLGVAPVEIPTGHCPNVSQPDRLAEIILATTSRACG